MNAKNKYTYWLHAGVYSGLQKLSVLLFGILSTVILTRSIDKYEMGVWSLFLTIAGLTEVVRHGLIKNAVIKFLNSQPAAEHKDVLSAALFLNIVITSFIAIVLALLANQLAQVLQAPGLEYVLYVFVFGLMALIPFSHFEWVQNAHSDFKGIFYGYLARQIVTLSLIIIFIFLDRISIYNLALFYSMGIMAGAAVSYRFARKHLTGQFHITRQWLSRLWHFGKYVFGTNISSAVFRSTDQFLVSHFLNPATVALQSISLRVTNLTDIPSQVLGDILFPKSAQTVTEGNTQRIKYLYEKSVGAVLAFVMPATLFIFLFPTLILTIIAGSKYNQAAPYLRIVILAGLFMPFLKQFGTIMDSTGRPKGNFLVILFMAVVQIINCYLLIQTHFLIGAGIALLVTHTIGFIVTQRLLHQYYNINFINCFKYAFDFYPEMIQMLNSRVLAKLQKAGEV